MRLHTNEVTREQIEAAAAGIADGVTVEIEEYGSKSRNRAFEVVLLGNGGMNLGYSRSNKRHATWDEWGVLIARLYELDFGAWWGTNSKYPTYENHSDFHVYTQFRFEDLTLPEDTHYMHKWEFVSVSHWICKRCSAEKWG